MSAPSAPSAPAPGTRPPARPQLRLVPPLPPVDPTTPAPGSPAPSPPAQRTAARLLPRSRQRRAPFVLLLAVLLAGGLVGLLLLNTVIAQDAFALHRLDRTQSQLDDQEATLRARAEQLDDPAVLAQQARALGMVPAGDPSFLRGTRPSGAVPPGVRTVTEGQRVGDLLVVGSRPGAPAAARPPPPASPASPPAASPPATRASAPVAPRSAAPTARPQARPSAAARPAARPSAPTTRGARP